VRVAALSAVAAFGAYFAMYGFRKPFTAASWAAPAWFGVDGKTVLLAAQVLGYTLSKFLGIRVVSSVSAPRRVPTLLVLIAAAELALLLLPLVPHALQPVCLFANGLPLGMVFGLVMAFLEGRRLTEAAAAGLCASFIVADGFAKSVGSQLLAAGVTEVWMPAVAGLLFAPLLLICVRLLARVPPPDAEDVAARAPRPPMTRDDRRAFLRRHGTGLACIVLAYLAITVLRSVRADFSPELWRSLGYGGAPSLFTWSELLVAALVLVGNGAVVLIGDNHRAFRCGMGVGIAGLLLCIVATALSSSHRIDGFAFMVLVGLGLYLPYVAVHTTLFERLVALTRDRGNLGFLLYLADSFGYLGYVAVMFGRGALGAGDLLGFFRGLVYVAACSAAVCLTGALLYFARRSRRQPAAILR